MNKIKEKNGISIVFFSMFTVFFVFFLAIVLDIGKGYLYRQQLQAISDSVVVAGANYGGQIVYNDFGNGREGRIQIDASKAKKKIDELVRENLKTIPYKNVKISYNFDNKLTKSQQNILYGAGVLRIDISLDVPGFIGSNILPVRTTAMTVLSSTSSAVKNHKVEVTRDRIRIYNAKNRLVLDEKLD